MTQEQPDVTISGRVPQVTKEKLEDISEDENVSRSALVREMVEDGIERRERDEPTRVEKYLQRVQEFATTFLLFVIAFAGVSRLSRSVGAVSPAADATAFNFAAVVAPATFGIICLMLALTISGIGRWVGVRLGIIKKGLPQVS